jgi:MFS family permease
MAAMFLGASLLGQWSDKIGRKKVLIFALSGVIVSCLISIVSLFLKSVLLLLLSRILVGLVDGSQAIAQAAVMDMSQEEKQKVKNIALITTAGTLGWIIGPMLGGMLSDKNLGAFFGYPLPFWVATVFAVLNLIWLRYSMRETYVPSAQNQVSLGTMMLNILKDLGDKRFVILSIAYFSAMFAWAFMYQVNNLLLAQKFHYSGLGLGLYSTCISVLFAFFSLVGVPQLLKYLSVRTITKVSMALMFFGILLLVILPEAAFSLWLGALFIVSAMAVLFNALTGLFSESVGPTEQGKVMGVNTALIALAWLAAGLYTSVVSFLPYSLFFIFPAVLLLFATLLLYRRLKNDRH